MFVLCVGKLLKSKGITKPYPWLKAHGINHHTAYKLLHKSASLRVPIEVLHTICAAAWCTPSDLFEWTPTDPIADIPTHPLQALRPKAHTDLLTKIQKLSPQQLATLEAELNKVV